VTQWHQFDAEDVLRCLESDPRQGLDETEAAARLVRFGPNEIVEQGRKSPWRMVWEQLTSVLVLILIAAAAISVALGDARDALAILAIVALNTLLGFVQEYRAEKAIQALRQMAVPRARVRRNAIHPSSAPTITPSTTPSGIRIQRSSSKVRRPPRGSIGPCTTIPPRPQRSGARVPRRP